MARGAREQQVEQRRLRLQRQQDVVVEGQRRQHAGDLEFQAHAGAGPLVGDERRDVAGRQSGRCPAVGILGARDAFHQRALAGAVRSDQAVKFVFGDGELGAVKRGQLAEDLDDARGFKERHDGSPSAAAETADALALAEDEADQAERTEQDHQQQQHAEDDRPDVVIIVRQPEADALDDDGADHRADQRAGAAEQHVEHDLRRHHHAQHVGPDEALVEGIEAAGEPGDGAADREDDRLQMLHLVAEEGDALLVLAQAGERQPELRAHQEAAQQIDHHQDAEREIVIDRPFREFVAAERHRRDRRNAVLAAEIVPAARQPIGGIRAGRACRARRR